MRSGTGTTWDAGSDRSGRSVGTGSRPGVSIGGRRVFLLTHVLGYAFNPVNSCGVFGGDGRLDLAVAEINNTFGETFGYVLNRRGVERGMSTPRFQKVFHISPFLPKRMEYEFHLSLPGGSLAVHVDDRDLPAEGTSYDRVVSIEMLEAAGYRYLPGYFEKVDRLLAQDGIAVIPSITGPDDRHERLLRRPDFIQKHVFPGSHCPSVGAIASAVAARSRLLIHHLEDVGAHYAETLRRGRAAFLANLPRVRQLGSDERFVRLWDFDLSYCEGGFATRHLGDVQLVLTRSGNHALGPVPGTPDVA